VGRLMREPQRLTFAFAQAPPNLPAPGKHELSRNPGEGCQVSLGLPSTLDVSKDCPCARTTL